MCKDCGCSINTSQNQDFTETQSITDSDNYNTKISNIHSNPQLNDKKTIDVIKKILDKNDHEANHNREHFNNHNILAINLMSSPGAGKTTLLENLASVVNFKFSVIEGDLETNKDAQRLKEKGIQAYQIQTGSACHLDAFMVHKALHHLELENIDVCFVENVGNLVCPASYDVGTHLNIVLVSIPEGEDKIAKYPVMFRNADLILFTKTDLLPYFNYDIEAEKKVARTLKPNVDILEVNINDIESIKQVANWIEFKQKMR